MSPYPVGRSRWGTLGNSYGIFHARSNQIFLSFVYVSQNFSLDMGQKGLYNCAKIKGLFCLFLYRKTDWASSG